MTLVSEHIESDTRERILEVAERLFRLIGYQKTTVGDIAKELRMSPANVYRFFESKKAIHMAVAQGAAVGGGSLIYANISAVPDRSVFDKGWPPEITWEAMAPHYDVVGQVMNVQPVPDSQWPRRLRSPKTSRKLWPWA